VTRAGAPDRGAIRNALESGLSYSGVMREYRPAFTPERHDALDRSQLKLARFDGRGRIVPAD
jgi:branched-chain amino acid transport system substrate-binding protein